jgi:DNA-binding PadR family transcriptional regulator
VFFSFRQLETFYRPTGSSDFPHSKPEPVDTLPHLYYAVNQMAKPESLGIFEQVILTALMTLRDNAYGVTIREKAGQLSHPKPVSIGAVYVTLDRLEEKGLISSWLSEPTPERGGRAKRCYQLEPSGRRALQEAAVTAKRIWDSTADVWGKNWAREGGVK